MAEATPIDVAGDDLLRVYAGGAARLESIVRAGLRRGLDPSRVGPDAKPGDATLAYRQRQLEQARGELARLRALAERGARFTAQRAYAAPLRAIDATLLHHGLARAGVTGTFGGIHTAQVEVLAGNLERSLTAAVDRAGANVESVFARASALEGAHSPGGVGGAVNSFVGRRVNDPWRKAALEQIATGTIALDTRPQISAALAERLIRDGTTDALTGFVDAAGRRWPLDRYAAMVARTTMREAASRATVNRLREHDVDLVQVSSHEHAEDECDDYDGGTFSLSGDDPTYPVLDELPPFHPNCAHVLTPADVGFDAYVNELEAAAAGEPGPLARETAQNNPPLPSFGGSSAGAAAADVAEADVEGFAPAPFSSKARPSRNGGTRRRFNAEQEVESWRLDPGPDLEAQAARWADIEGEDTARVKALRREARNQAKALDEALGPDAVAALKDLAEGGITWARDADLKRALIAGDTTIDDVLELAEQELGVKFGRRLERERLAHEKGFKKGAFPCFVCGRFKPRPSSICDHCGDEPGTYRGNAADFNRAYGYSH